IQIARLISSGRKAEIGAEHRFRERSAGDRRQSWQGERGDRTPGTVRSSRPLVWSALASSRDHTSQSARPMSNAVSTGSSMSEDEAHRAQQGGDPIWQRADAGLANDEPEARQQASHLVFQIATQVNQLAASTKEGTDLSAPHALDLGLAIPTHANQFSGPLALWHHCDRLY